MLKLAVPITIQQLVLSSTNLLDVLMIGQLGESSIAALGLSNQIFFLLSLFLFGISSGSAIFTAQYWGRGDMVNLRKVMGIGLTLALSVGAFYTLIALFIPEIILGFYTNDPVVIEIGSQYLRIVGFGYIFTAVSLTYMFVLRSTQNVRLPMAITIVALSTNVFLNYCLIFGNFGFPQLGVEGAAIGTLIARILEFGLMIFFSYRFKTAAAAKLEELRFSFSFFKQVLKTSMPAAINEVVWSLGITTYYAVYAHIGTDAVAAVNITSTIENMTFVFFIGAANACAIMIGNQIGAGNEKVAYDYGIRFLVISFLLSIFFGTLVIILRPLILSLYNIGPTSYDYAFKIQFIYGISMWIRTVNLMLFIGILRSGGDTQFALKVELGSVWLIGVPIALIGGLVLHLSVYYVYALVLLEEIVKLSIVRPRFISRKWVHNLTSITE
jgi:putative MATE family efflux protein